MSSMIRGEIIHEFSPKQHVSTLVSFGDERDHMRIGHELADYFGWRNVRVNGRLIAATAGKSEKTKEYES